jgi:hypothetical protein
MVGAKIAKIVRAGKRDASDAAMPADRTFLRAASVD